MAQSKELRKARNARYWEAHKGTIRRTPNRQKFIGIDGEGAGTDQLGRQHYLLLCGAGRELFHHNRPLSTEDCLEFILSMPQKAILVGYFFTYDVTMILRDLEESYLRKIIHPQMREDGKGRMLYTYWKKYAIDFRPRQYFRVARVKKQKIVADSARTINETGGFFLKSFVEALKDWQVGAPDVVDFISQQKDRRSDFQEITQIERTYCQLECDLLSQLMEKLRDMCGESGVIPGIWRGAGSIASKLHTMYKTPKREEQKRPKGLELSAIQAYFGGRFEISEIGNVPGPIFEYDISSAYPSKMALLPCPIHTRWYKSKVHTDGIGDDFLLDITFQHGKTINFCGLPFRTKEGILTWPRAGRGTYWGVEVKAAANADPDFRIIEYHGGWTCWRTCQCQLFSWVPALYAKRKEFGKTTKGIPLKLGLNALYGKLAQRQGGAPFRDYIAAGLITAHTRAQLINAYSQAPDKVVMLATDAVYSRVPLNLDVGEGLGQWELKEHPNGMFIVQPGLYWTSEGTPKTRGVPRARIIEQRLQFEQSWDKWIKSKDKIPPSVNIHMNSFIGHRLALARNKPELAGRWAVIQKKISFDWFHKRDRGAFRHPLIGFVRTRPQEGSPELQSTPFDPKLLTVIMETELELEAAPDFDPPLSEGT